MVEVLPLGGANEVGASSALIKVSGVSILIDAGVRVGGIKRGGPLPDFDKITEAPDTMLVTHAHMDHTGALPGIVPKLGRSLIHMTTPTLHLLQALQGDNQAKARDEDHEGTKTSYTPEEIEAMLSLVMAHPFCKPFCPIENRPDIVVEFWPNGHILGSSSILIDTPEARIVWTGDYSVTPQPTIGGLDIEGFVERLKDRPVDIVVSEGTYGISAHPTRQDESERFLDLLDKVAERGGKTLIPAFALGRAQDLVHTIREGKLAGRLVDVPVYLDGMTQPITSVYQNIAHQVYPHMQEPLVLLDPEHLIMKANAQSRAKIMSDDYKGPCIVIASSGMLIGGKSVEYAKAFAGDRRNAIFLSGYQDEESPGRHLLKLRRGGKWRLADGTKLTVKCTFGRYHTSAHADGVQIQEVIKALNPKRVALVHGDSPSLSALAEAIGNQTKVLINGESWGVETEGPLWEVTPPAERPVAAIGRLPDLKEIRELWNKLTEDGGRDYSDRELATMILGPRYSSTALAQLNSCLEQHRLYFHTGSRIGERSYRPRTQEELMEMMMERQIGTQIPVYTGDVVIFADGSPDLFAGLVIDCDKQEAEGFVAGTPRRKFRREWIRGLAGVGAEEIKSSGVKVAGATRWFDGVVREAKSLPGWNMVELFWNLQGSEDGIVSVLSALEFMGRKDASPAEKIAMAFCLAGAKSLFTPTGDGSFRARTFDEAAKRNRAFARLKRVKEAGADAQIQLVTGECVTTTGVTTLDSFEAKTESGRTVRINYRRVLLPGESAQTPVTRAAPRKRREEARPARTRTKGKSRRGGAKEANGQGAQHVDAGLPILLPDGRIILPEDVPKINGHNGHAQNGRNNNNNHKQNGKTNSHGKGRNGEVRRPEPRQERKQEPGERNVFALFSDENKAITNRARPMRRLGKKRNPGEEGAGEISPDRLAEADKSPPLC